MTDRRTGGRRVGLRAAAALVGLALALTGLTACRTNVGNAATIDGHRVTESDVDGYFTGSAKPVQADQDSVAPRSFVLSILIDERLTTKLLSTPPATSPSAGKVATLTSSALKASGGRASVIKAVGLAGYTTKFQDLFIRSRVLQILLHQEAGDSQGTRTTADLAEALKFDAATSFPVRVNPRYGSWNPSTLALSSAGTLPSYLTLQPTSAT